MGRFSCFHGHMQSHKHKKSSQPSFEEMVKMLQLGNNNPDTSSKSTNPMMVDYEAKSVSCDSEHSSLSPHGWKSDDRKHEYHADRSTNSRVFGMGNLRRSFSVGCELGHKRRMYENNNTNNCIDHECYFESSHDYKLATRSTSPNDKKSTCTTPQESYHYQEGGPPVSRYDLSSSMMNHESSFSIDEPRLLEKEDNKSTNAPLYMVCADKTDKTDRKTDTISKCYSMPNFESVFPTGRGFPHSQNESFEDLNIRDNDEGSSSPQHDAGTLGMTWLNQDDNNYGKVERYDSCNYSSSNKDWIVPEPDEITGTTHEETVFSPLRSDHLPNLDFKVKRIEDWVSDLQHCSPVDASEEVDDTNDEVKKGNNGYIDGIDATRASIKVNPNVEAAKKYMSSLNASTNTAHLANHGLVVVPLLSAFVALKVINLSGNSIVRITAGALPRGLHMLNLSKNKISAIEGLKELTRLRVLDLSYNKISRLGHGLASCSSLKELYLAGNKISEVEGLHRLLKLSVLDLRFNKIATTKCLGQLAANYNSLQAISLEGNPAQKNVGDDQLKKYLQSLLPQLSYYNRQHIKSSTVKDSSDRSVRLGISGSLRSDHKSSPRRGGNSLKQRTSSSSNLAQKGGNTDYSPKQLRGRRGPPSGTRPSRHQRFEIEKERQLERLRVGFSLHKSRSEGMLSGLQVSSSSAGACDNC